MFKEIRSRFVKLVYADHNRSRAVKKSLEKVLTTLSPNDVGLNIGAGFTRLHPQVKNLDIFEGEYIDIVGKAENIPLADESIALVITQEALEHIQDPFKAVEEMYRILRKGGFIYCQVPFIIGYHPGPTDFWRFTVEGIKEIFEKHNFECIEVGISVGSGTGFYRIAVEFFALLFSLPIRPLYHIFKALFALIFFPIKWLDYLFVFSNQNDRIAGGYYVIMKKTV
jgi:SAM-dependent methyltransferase